MKQFLGIGLIGVGAYLIYNMMNQDSSNVLAVDPGTGAGPAGNTTQLSNQVAAGSLINRLLLAAGANRNTLHDADTWSYFFATVSESGSIPPNTFDAVFISPFNGDRTRTYTAEGFLAALAPTGLKGFGGLGWGNPNHLNQPGKGFGALGFTPMNARPLPFGYGNSPDATFFETTKRGFGN